MDNILDKLGNSEQIWEKIKGYAKTAGIESTRIMLELFYVMKSPDTPIMDKTIIGAALAYQILPKDLLSTKNLGILGLVDNAAALLLAYKKVKQRVTPEIKSRVDETIKQWFGDDYSNAPTCFIGNDLA